MDKKDEILKILADNLTNHLKVIMEASYKKLSNEEAETMMSNVAMYVLKNKLNKGL